MKKQKGFTLIELLVVIAIIGLLSTLAVVALNNARQKSRDTRRVADIKQIQTALELYYNDCNGYPSGTKTGTGQAITGTVSCSPASQVYMSAMPTAPEPNDGTCTAATNTYTYTQDAASTYHITYCLGAATGGIAAGAHTATPAGMQNP